MTEQTSQESVQETSPTPEQPQVKESQSQPSIDVEALKADLLKEVSGKGLRREDVEAITSNAIRQTLRDTFAPKEDQASTIHKTFVQDPAALIEGIASVAKQMAQEEINEFKQSTQNSQKLERELNRYVQDDSRFDTEVGRSILMTDILSYKAANPGADDVTALKEAYKSAKKKLDDAGIKPKQNVMPPSGGSGVPQGQSEKPQSLEEAAREMINARRDRAREIRSRKK